MQELHRALKKLPSELYGWVLAGVYNFMQELHRAVKKIRPIRHSGCHRHSGAERDYGVRSDVCLRHTCRREVAKVE